MSYTKVVMRIVDHRSFARRQKNKKLAKRFLIAGFVTALAALTVGGAVIRVKRTEVTANGHAEQPAPKTGQLRNYSNDEFKALALSIRYPNTQLFAEPPPISGNREADDRIRSVAEARGYRLTSIPVGAIQKIDEPRLDGDDLLQPLAAISWQELKASAARDNIPLSILSAYRSPEYQRDLFMKRLLARGVSVEQIAAGQGDQAVESTLELTALPGYSRHHTGYTIDLWCEDRTGTFLSSSCYKWISADNYKKAKEAGWIPSYPEGVIGQGPEPEPWEYVWAGKDLLTE